MTYYCSFYITPKEFSIWESRHICSFEDERDKLEM